MKSTYTTGTSGNANQFGPRQRSVDHFVVHHAANSSLPGVLSMMATGSRQVSSNYVVKDGNIVSVVPEEFRSWSLGDANWDSRSITVETCNSAMGDASGWPISEATYISLALLISDVATRYKFPINRDTVIGHREVNSRYGGSYPTVCPGGIDLDKLVKLANDVIKTPATTNTKEVDMFLINVNDKSFKEQAVYLATPNGLSQPLNGSQQSLYLRAGLTVVDMSGAERHEIQLSLDDANRGRTALVTRKYLDDKLAELKR